MEKHNKLENEKEEVQVNDKDGYKKSPIIRPRIKRKFRLEALEARKKNFNSKFGDGCDAADNKDGYNMQQEEQEEEESQWMIPGTPPKERPLRLRKKALTHTSTSSRRRSRRSSMRWKKKRNPNLYWQLRRRKGEMPWFFLGLITKILGSRLYK